MKTCYPIVTLSFCLLFQSQGEIGYEALLEFAEAQARGQIGDPTEWNASGSGGYLLRFSCDITGDGAAEEFLASSMMLNKTRGLWLIYIGKNPIGYLDLSLHGFIVTRHDGAIGFPYGYEAGGHQAFLVEQFVKNREVSTKQTIGTPEELQKFLTQSESEGQIIRPDVQVILFSDFVKGMQTWRPIDLDRDAYGFRGEQYLVIRGDEERFRQGKLTPEEALNFIVDRRTELKSNRP